MSLNEMNKFDSENNVPEGCGPENCGPLERPAFSLEEELRRYEYPSHAKFTEPLKNGKKEETETFGRTGHLPEGCGPLERPSEGMMDIMGETKGRVEDAVQT